MQSNENTQLVNNTTIGGSGAAGFEFVTGTSSFSTSTYCINCLSLNNSSYGFYISGQPNWGIDFSNGFAGSPNFQPTIGDSHITNSITANPNTGMPSGSQVGKNSGQCVVYIPSGNTNLKGKGKNGADIGANIIYRYEDGVLTNTKLWDQTTGQFPCGAVVSGLNDIAGSSCLDVNQRLNVGVNGCLIP